MNKGKRGSPYKFPNQFVNLMVAGHQLVDYRGLEGMERRPEEYKVIRYFGDYTKYRNWVQKKNSNRIILDKTDLKLA